MARKHDSNIAKQNRGSKRVNKEGLKKELSIPAPFDIFDYTEEDLHPLAYQFKVQVIEPLLECKCITGESTLMLWAYFTVFTQLVDCSLLLAETRVKPHSPECFRARKAFTSTLKDFVQLSAKLGLSTSDKSVLYNIKNLNPNNAHGNSDAWDERFDQRM